MWVWIESRLGLKNDNYVSMQRRMIIVAERFHKFSTHFVRWVFSGWTVLLLYAAFTFWILLREFLNYTNSPSTPFQPTLHSQDLNCICTKKNLLINRNPIVTDWKIKFRNWKYLSGLVAIFAASLAFAVFLLIERLLLLNYSCFLLAFAGLYEYASRFAVSQNFPHSPN